MSKLNLFKITYHKVGRPTGTRTNEVYSGSYEELLFAYFLNKKCNKYYYHDYFFSFQNNHLFIERKSVNGPLCIYSIKFYDMQDWSKFLCEYHVEIDCLVNNGDYNLPEENMRKDFKSLPNPTIQNQESNQKSFTIPGKIFFFLMVAAPGIKLKKYAQVKSYMVKSTYYKHKKHCIEQGYIVDGKLTKEFRDWRKREFPSYK